MSEKRVGSRSDAQRAAEHAAIEAFSWQLGVPIASQRLSLGGQHFDIDGYFQTENRIVLVEVWAHVGPVKPAQRHKVMSDILKLALLQRLLIKMQPAQRIESYIVFIDRDAANVIQNASWGTLAAKEFGVKPIHVPIPMEYIDAVRAAQVKQDIRTEQ